MSPSCDMIICSFFLVMMVPHKPLFLVVSEFKMGKRKKVVVNKERTIKGMANAVSSDEGEADGQDMVSLFSFLKY